MYQKTRGIVLHTIKYSDTSVISKIYTEKFGLVSYMVKGVRTSKSKAKASLLQPFTLLEMEVTNRENRQLQFIKEFRRAYNYHSVPFDTLKSTIALFLLEVISKSIREHEGNTEMFEFIYETCCALDSAEKLNPVFPLLFLVHFTRYLGFAPHGNFSEKNCFFEMSEGVFRASENTSYVLNKEDSKLLSELSQTSLFDPSNVRVPKKERKQMLSHLIRYYQFHLENFSLKSPEILEDILG